LYIYISVTNACIRVVYFLHIYHACDVLFTALYYSWPTLRGRSSLGFILGLRALQLSGSLLGLRALQLSGFLLGFQAPLASGLLHSTVD